MIRLSVLASFALAACSAAPQPPQPANAPAPVSAPILTAVERGQAFAQARCSACHAITADGVSPNPESPPFAAIINKPGLTRDTLRGFLRDSHNFPDAMNFHVEPEQVNDLADYMLTLRTPDYRPPI